MISTGIFRQIVQYVETSRIDIQSQFDNQGRLLGYKIKSLDDSDLHCVAIPVAEMGVQLLKKNFILKLVQDYKAGKQMPFLV